MSAAVALPLLGIAAIALDLLGSASVALELLASAAVALELLKSAAVTLELLGGAAVALALTLCTAACVWWRAERQHRLVCNVLLHRLLLQLLPCMRMCRHRVQSAPVAQAA